MPRKHYSTAAYNELTTAVEAFINDNLSVKDVCEIVHRNRQTAGTTAGVAPYFIEAVEGIICSILLSRLRDASTDAILVGRKHLRDGHVERLAQSITDAKQSGFESFLDVPEFRHVWHNLLARNHAASASLNDSVQCASWMIRQLVNAARRSPGEGGGGILDISSPNRSFAVAGDEQPLLGSPVSPTAAAAATQANISTNARRSTLGMTFGGFGAEPSGDLQFAEKTVITMATQGLLCTALLPLLVARRDIADLAVRFGLIDALRKGLLRSKSHPSQEHPRFAIGASCLLAEIALHSAHEVEQQSEMARVVRPFLKSSHAMDIRHLSSWGSHALDSLKIALERSIECHEHATLWGIMLGLQRCVENHFCCETLLLMGFLPVLRDTLDKYLALPADEPLPLAIDYQEDINPAPLMMKRELSVPIETLTKEEWTQSAPAFPNRIASPALERCTTSVKAHWLSKKPHLPPLKRHTYADVAAVNASGRRTSDLRILPKAALDTMPTDSEKDTEGVRTLLRMAVEAPNDGLGHQQVCDRNFIILRLRKLLGAMEKTRQHMKRPFASHAPETKGGEGRDSIGLSPQLQRVKSSPTVSRSPKA